MTEDQFKPYEEKLTSVFAKMEVLTKELNLTDIEAADIFVGLVDVLAASFETKAKELKGAK